MKIFIFHAQAGYGHKKIAEVIDQAFLARGLSDQEVTVEDALHYTSPMFRKSYPGIYYYLVKHYPHSWGWFYEKLDDKRIYNWIRLWRSFYNRVEGRQLLKKVMLEDPDYIICTHFFSAELFARAKREGKLRGQLITVITDFFPHTFWVNEGTTYYWVMNETTAQDLIRRKINPAQIIAGGIPADPVFKPSGNKKAILEQYRFSADRLTLLITSGGFGFGPYPEILRRLEAFSDRLQCFVVCGNNQEMKDLLDKEHYRFPVHIFGFVNFMDDLMEASDLMLAKPGGSTTCESLMKGIPMVVLDPIPGQETRNAKFLEEHNACFTLQKPEQIHSIFESIFSDPTVLQAKKEAVARIAKPHAADDLVTFVLSGLR